MSVITSSSMNLDTLIAALPATVTSVLVEGNPIESASQKTITVDGNVTDIVLQTAINTAAGQFIDRTANNATIQTLLQTALTNNAQDITQDNSIITQAATITATSGTLTTLQLSNFVRSLAQAASVQAQNDINTKRQLNRIIRKLLNQYDGTG